jgi:predicted O-methyltransferase YrrM
MRNFLIRKARSFALRLVTPIRYKFEKLANSIWYDFPFGISPKASKDNYLELASRTKKESYKEVEEYEKRTGFTIDVDWLQELALHTQIVVKESALCYTHGRVLYSALSLYLKKLKVDNNQYKINIIETGTARGFSSLCMAKALHDTNSQGLIITFDVLPHHAKMYWNCIDDLDGPKTRSALLKPWRSLVESFIVFIQGDTKLQLPRVQVERVHFAFLDGAHTYEDVLFEFHQIKNYQKKGDMIIYDDYTPSQFPGLVIAVDEICEKFSYEKEVLQAHSGRGYVVAIKE